MDIENLPRENGYINLFEDLAIIDKSQIEQILPPDDESSAEILKEIVEMYYNENMPRVELLKSINEQKDTEALRSQIHFLAGSSFNIGLQRMGNICKHIEIQIKENTFSGFSNCYEIIKKEFLLGVDALRQMTNN